MSSSNPLIALTDRATEAGAAERIVEELREGLCSLIGSGTMTLPENMTSCCPGHYARRLVHRDPQRGYSIVAMTWDGNQGTSLHDHAGLWCVESVWLGSIEVLTYEMMEQRDALFRFEKRGSMRAGVGSAGCLIPPHDYHVIRNPTAERAVSVHIYGGDMAYCNVFQEREPGWFERQAKPLGFDT